MQALFFASLFLFTINLVNGCTTYPDDPLRTAIVQRICELQKDVSDLYESLLKPDEVLGLQTTDAPMQKRKNEFIRFGKRGDGTVAKRKNEFIRFGKRKNEFIRFGRSQNPMVLDDVNEMVKRKNEFIRFG